MTQIKTEKDLRAERRDHIKQLADESINTVFARHGLTGQVAEKDIYAVANRRHLTTEIADCFSAKLREAGIMPAIDLSKESFGGAK